VVAELKRRSPSKGDLAPALDPAATAAAYASGGATCLSVLTDGPYFGGTVDDLQRARAACDLPVLRKDFVIDEVQVYETRAVGADAMLLIVAAVPDDDLLRDLHALGCELGLGVLVEAHDRAELERALTIGGRVVGVNARDLGTFAEDLGVGEQIVDLVPPDVVVIAESAIRSRADAERMAKAGFDAVLVGEMLVTSPDPTGAVRDLASVPRRSRAG
jgi:indole-3-glycerol phosphate synthase